MILAFDVSGPKNHINTFDGGFEFVLNSRKSVNTQLTVADTLDNTTIPMIARIRKTDVPDFFWGGAYWGIEKIAFKQEQVKCQTKSLSLNSINPTRRNNTALAEYDTFFHPRTQRAAEHPAYLT